MLEGLFGFDVLVAMILTALCFLGKSLEAQHVISQIMGHDSNSDNDSDR